MLPLAVPVDREQADYPLTLNTGRVRDQWHAMTRTGRVPRLMTHIAEPRLSLHPRDAALRGIADGDLARIDSAQGKAVLRASLDPSMRRGDVFLPMHWTDQFAASGPADRLVHALTDPISGQPDLKRTKVQVAAVAETWRGFLLRSVDGALRGDNAIHWSKAPIEAGFAYHLSGMASLAGLIDAPPALRDLLALSDGADLVSYADPRQSVFRFAGLSADRLDACLFLAEPAATFPEAEQASRLLGQELTRGQRLALLAGREADSAPASKIVCSCFSVSEAAICKVIRSELLHSPVEIGAALRAGTNCGSCIPELKKLLMAAEARVAVSP